MPDFLLGTYDLPDTRCRSLLLLLLLGYRILYVEPCDGEGRGKNPAFWVLRDYHYRVSLEALVLDPITVATSQLNIDVRGRTSASRHGDMAH